MANYLGRCGGDYLRLFVGSHLGLTASWRLRNLSQNFDMRTEQVDSGTKIIYDFGQVSAPGSWETRRRKYDISISSSLILGNTHHTDSRIEPWEGVSRPSSQHLLWSPQYRRLGHMLSAPNFIRRYPPVSPILICSPFLSVTGIYECYALFFLLGGRGT